MSADLSYLFRETAPAGAMAGVQQGISNAKSLMDLEKMRSDMNTSEFNLDSARQKLPLDLARMRSENAIKAHEASPDMLALDKRQKTANAGVTEAQYKEAMQKISTQDIASIQQQMNQLMQIGLDMGMKGKSGADAIDYIGDMLITKRTNASDPETQKHYDELLTRLQNDPSIAEMRKWTPQQLVDQTQLALLHQSKITPDYIKSEMEQIHADKRAQIGADATIRTASERGISEKNPTDLMMITRSGRERYKALGYDPKKVDAGVYDHEIQLNYKRQVQNMQLGDVNLTQDKGPQLPGTQQGNNDPLGIR